MSRKTRIAIAIAAILGSAGLALGIQSTAHASPDTHVYGMAPVTHVYGAQPQTHVYG